MLPLHGNWTLEIALWSQNRKIISGHNLKNIGGQAIVILQGKKKSQSKIWMALIIYIPCWDYHMIRLFQIWMALIKTFYLVLLYACSSYMLKGLGKARMRILNWTGHFSSKPKPFLFTQNLDLFFVSCMLGFLIEINKMVLLNLTM